jgi:hypothetical protein
MKPHRLSRTFAAFCVPVLLLTLTVAALAQTRVVAIGDVHGAYPELVTILKRTGLIDENRRWTGGAAILIQTGDVVDRGPGVRACLDLLMELESQAKKKRGKVIPLLGNHESLNIMADLRYVTPEIFSSFATAQSEKVRARAYRDYLKFLAIRRDQSAAAPAPDDEAMRQKWMDEHPPGYFEYCDAFGPGGKYGRWIRAHRAIVQAGDGLFLHGGLNPALSFGTIAQLDEQVRAGLAEFDSIWKSLSEKKVIWRYMRLAEAVQQVAEELKRVQAAGQIEDPETARQMLQMLDRQNWLAVSPDGPLWFRGLAQEAEEKLTSSLDAILGRLKLRYVVTGHTVQSKLDITSRFGNRVFLIDTGMYRQSYGGVASALEIQNGRFTAYYADREPRVLVMPASGKTGAPARRGPGNRVERR